MIREISPCLSLTTFGIKRPVSIVYKSNACVLWSLSQHQLGQWWRLPRWELSGWGCTQGGVQCTPHGTGARKHKALQGSVRRGWRYSERKSGWRVWTFWGSYTRKRGRWRSRGGAPGPTYVLKFFYFLFFYLPNNYEK